MDATVGDEEDNIGLHFGGEFEDADDKRGQELILDIISVPVTLFANSFALFRGV